MARRNPAPASPFGVLDNKSLDTGDLETKQGEDTPAEQTPDTEPESPPALTVPVKMLHHSRIDGRDLLPGHRYDLPRPVAAQLTNARRAVRV